MSGADVDHPALNVRIHAQILDPTPYRELHRAAHALLARAQRYAIVHTVPGYRAHTNDGHARLVELVEQRDLDAVRRLNRDHITTATGQLIQRVEAQLGSESSRE